MIAFLNLPTEPHHFLLKIASSGHSIEISFDFKDSFSQSSVLLLLPLPAGLRTLIDLGRNYQKKMKERTQP